MRRLSFLIILLLMCPGISKAGKPMRSSGPALTASLDRDSAVVGSVVTLNLEYSLPKGSGFSAHPEIKGLEDLTEVNREIGPDEIRVTLLVDRLGSWKTGPISLAYVDRDGKSRNLKTEPVSLTVLSNLGEKPEDITLRPIRGIMPTEPTWLKVLPWAAGIVILLLIVSVILRLYKKYRSRKSSMAATDPPHIRAQRELEDLDAAGLFEKGEVKAYYFRFSEILRRYLESLRGFPAAEFTTEEIALFIAEESDRSLMPLLRQADLVKFADTVPTNARKEEIVRAALSYIRETSPAENNDYDTDGSGETVQ